MSVRSNRLPLMRYIPHMFLALCLAAGLGLSGCATLPTDPTGQNEAAKPKAFKDGIYNESELVSAVSAHLGVTSESAASVVERLFRKQGSPVGYITGQERGGAIGIGVRYGEGQLWMKDGRSQKVYWQGPSIGFDMGADGSKVFTLVYNLDDPNYLYQRFPGVEGSAFLVAGMAVNYQRANGISLAPIRTGVGARLGANVGYLAYTRKRHILPF